MKYWLATMWRQLWKELYQSRWTLLIFAAITVWVTAMAMQLAPVPTGMCVDECGTPRDSAVASITLLMLGTFLLLVASVVQHDSPTRADAYWVSQPIAPTPIVAAKLLFLVGVALIAVVSSQMSTAVSFGFSPIHALPSVAKSSHMFGSAILFGMCVAAITPNIRTYFAALLGLGALWFLSAIAFFRTDFAGVYEQAHILGLRGDLWMIATCALLVWVYVARSITVSRRKAVAIFGLILLMFSWQPADSGPMRVLSGGARSSSFELPEAVVHFSGDTGVYRIELGAPVPARERRYRFVSGLLTLVHADGTTKILPDEMGPWNVEQAGVNYLVGGDSSQLRINLALSMDVATRQRTNREGGSLVLDVFLEEQARVRVGELPMQNGASVTHQNERITLRSAPGDSLPSRAYIETLALPVLQIFARSGDGGESSHSKDDAVLSHLPWYVREFHQAMRTNEDEIRAAFNGGKDTITLWEGGKVQSVTTMPLALFGAERTYGDYAARKSHGEPIDTTVKWANGGTLLISRWEYRSHRSIRAVLKIPAK